jgi:hypothetical protein
MRRVRVKTSPSPVGSYWISKDGKKKRHSNDIAAVTAECGNYCWGCSLTSEELKRIGFTLSVHHTLRHAEHGETGRKIPLCSRCHDDMSTNQQRHRQTLTALSAGAAGTSD